MTRQWAGTLTIKIGDCSGLWNAILVFSRFIRKYCEDAGVEIHGISAGMPGSVLSHTIRGHDLSLSYFLRPADLSHEREETVEVRIREIDFEPLITIFGTTSQMRDYKSSTLTTTVGEYIKNCIDRTLR